MTEANGRRDVAGRELEEGMETTVDGTGTASAVPDQEAGAEESSVSVMEQAGLEQPAAPLESEEAADGGFAGLGEEELNAMIAELCISKVEEFQLLGYEHVTGPEIWECVSDKYEQKGYPPLHRIVNDILSLKVTQFMNWMTMRVYKGPLV